MCSNGTFRWQPSVEETPDHVNTEKCDSIFGICLEEM